MISPADEAVIATQLGRKPRGLLAVAHRCQCGLPDVVTTAPRLPDATPFPTLYYLTCPRACAAISALEASGVMRDMTDRLTSDPDMRDKYQAAHQEYLRRRDEAAAQAGVEPLPRDTQSAGGMPTRVKCLHALVAHELAAGPGVNPFGREALSRTGDWWAQGPCVPAGAAPRGSHRRVAAIDCGTNSLRLLVADVTISAEALVDVVRRTEIVRLGQGVDRTGRLAAEALERMTVVLSEYAADIAAHGAQAVRMVATSATRDAGNAAEFTRRVENVLGIVPEVLSGDAEAWLSFAGATAELAGSGARHLVVDIGGGSTEFVLGAAGGRAEVQAVSVDIGSVRMTERHLHGDPPSATEIAAATADIDAGLTRAAAAIPALAGAAAAGTVLVGLAGSVTTVAAIALGLRRLDVGEIHHARVSAGQVHTVTQSLLNQTREARAGIAVLHPGRVDVIGAGALVLDRAMGQFGFGEVLVSEHDILDGIAWDLAREMR